MKNGGFMKKLQITSWLVLLLAIALPANGMMGWLAELGLWPTAQTQRAVNTHASTHTQPVAPLAPNTKKRKAAPEVVDLSHDESDEAEEGNEILLAEEVMLKQIDPKTKKLNGWECGYYAVFHYLASKNNWPSEGLRARYTQFINDLPTGACRIQINKVDRVEINFAQCHADRMMLNDDMITILLHYVNGAAIPASPQLISAFGYDFFMIASNHHEESFSVPPANKYVKKHVNPIKRLGNPFWVILCMDGHYVCLKFTPGNNIVNYYDSLNGYQAHYEGQAIFNQMVAHFAAPAPDVEHV